MKTITDKLADALRELSDARYVLIDALKQSNYADKTPAFHDAFDNARNDLAAYDAQQAVQPTCDPIAPGETIGETVDRVLCMADQFLEDWRESVDDDTARDSDLDEREQEWETVRPLILQRVNAHDALVSALQACQRVLDDNGGTTPQQWIDAEAAARDALEAAGVRHA